MNSILPILVAVLNSLWQAAIVAALVWLALKFLPGTKVTINAATRHIIWWATLAVVVVLPVTPRIVEVLHARAQPVPAAGKQVQSRHILEPAIVERSAIVTFQEERSATWPLWILTVWATVFLFRIIQIARSYFYLRGLKVRASASHQALPMLQRPAKLLLSIDVASPMAVGFLRPAVILPESLTDQLEEAEMEHILLHESAHVARYDDWTNLAVRLLGAILALHPVAMWILRQIEREREMACDDWVVARTGAARPYAASLARMSELRWSRRPELSNLKLASGLFGSGSRVGDRIEMLLKRGREFSPRVSPVRVTASAVTLLLMAIAGARTPRWIAFAKQADLPSFEVASVKPGNPNNPRISLMVQPGGRFTTTNASLQMLISFAYDIRIYQISRGPSWLDSPKFDIEAKAGGEPSLATGPGSSPPWRLMLQSLLAERFRLTTHRETREGMVYELVVDKGGSKLKETEAVEGKPQGLRLGRGQLIGKAVPLSILVQQLGEQVGRSVFDKTGLKGKYDFKLTWSDPLGPAGTAGGPDGGAPPPDPTGPSIFAAVQEDLGLKLQASKGPVEILVIDHVEKPSEN